MGLGLRQIQRRRQPLHTLLVVLGFACLAHMTMMVAVLSQFSFSSWYYSFFVLFLCLVLGCTLGDALERDRSPARSSKAERPRRFPLTAGIATVGHSIYRFAVRPPERNIHILRYEIALALRVAPLPEDARIGAWNAGELSYFSPLPVTNLDGLVNSNEFLEFLRTGDRIDVYLQREGIEYVLDYNEWDSTLGFQQRHWDAEAAYRGLWPWPQVEVVREFTSPDAPTMYLLRLPRIGSSR